MEAALSDAGSLGKSGAERELAPLGPGLPRLGAAGLGSVGAGSGRALPGTAEVNSLRPSQKRRSSMAAPGPPGTRAANDTSAFGAAGA